MSDLLKQYEELQARLSLVQSDIAQLKKAAFPVEVQVALDEIDEEFEPTLSQLAQEMGRVEKELKTQVVAGGETITGDRFQAVFVKGRVKWNAKKLEGMAEVIPAILTARSEGKPYVRLGLKKS